MQKELWEVNIVHEVVESLRRFSKKAISEKAIDKKKAQRGKSQRGVNVSSYV